MTQTPVDLSQLVIEIKQLATKLGFDLVGIAPAGPSVQAVYFRQWLDAGQAGQMEFLADRFAERTDPAVYLPGARTAICVAMNYHVPLDPAPAGNGKIARYALGEDYHVLIKNKLYDIADFVRERVPGAETRAGVDTVPVMEKELAARAGIGWMGKNTCVINPQIGSWIFLGEVLTTLDLPIDGPAVDRCGSCQRCIDACPTDALTPYELNATKCISYLTIEQRQGEIDPALQRGVGEWLYGCDICQDVCPFNRAPLTTLEPALQPRLKSGSLAADVVLNWQEDEFRAAFRNTAVKRIKLPQLQRNAKIVIANQTEERRDIPVPPPVPDALV